ncbi:hypothetical protein IscW_ISCW001361 [Ixodes scapularis]|uniref:Uncharacterized protein n=1 Tax=Ixodes scapularis TaxID=6945 RepID=B7P456_IXOSC|nr:hypothetical protein IscW_ISCW001361 [Ixodes scapularis]|eukprot:XP_002405326.1 hypothetical protein IscW_ISCW001361 [Ixodes scapularis]
MSSRRSCGTCGLTWVLARVFPVFLFACVDSEVTAVFELTMLLHGFLAVLLCASFVSADEKEPADKVIVKARVESCGG